MQLHELVCSSFICLSSSQEFRSACSSCLTVIQGGGRQIAYCLGPSEDAGVVFRVTCNYSAAWLGTLAWAAIFAAKAAAELMTESPEL